MWRLTALSIPVFLLSSAPVFVSATTPDDDIPVLKIHNDVDEHADDQSTNPTDENDETQVLELNDAEAPADNFAETDEEPVDDEPLDFITGYVDWEFVPIIEVRHASGAVTPVDVQRTVQADEEGIADCFEPTAYPGQGTVEVDVYLSYNGVPTSVNGNTDQVLRPTQARCVLQRAWRYQFPRLADNADEPSHLGYRVTFVGQKIDAPQAVPGQPQLLLERVSASETELREELASALHQQLETAERCAAMGLDEMPTDFMATNVHSNWRYAGEGRYVPTDVDITVTNKTSTELPSADVVDCYERVLSRWDVQLDGTAVDEFPEQLQGSYYVTVRPPGWYGI